MKNWIYAIAVACTVMSCEDQEDFYNEMHFSINQPVSWEISNNQLHLDVEVPALIPVDNSADVVNIYGSTMAQVIEFSLAIEKKTTNETWELVTSPAITNNTGATHVYPESGLYIGDLLLDQNAYTYSAVTNLSSGEYRINFAPNQISKNKMVLQTKSQNNQLTFILQSDLEGDTDGYYYFTIL